MHRIFLDRETLNDEHPRATGDEYHYLTRVLRVRQGTSLRAVCGDGFEYDVLVGPVNRREAVLQIIDRREVNRELPFEVHIYLGYLKAGSFQEVLGDLVECGATSVTPVIFSRCQASLPALTSPRRDRFRRIIQYHTGLSGRTRLMDVFPPAELSEALKQCRHFDHKVLFWEDHPGKSYNTPKPSPKDRVALFIGPEGGIDPDEVNMAREVGFVIASLGARTLRARLAPVVAIASFCRQS